MPRSHLHAEEIRPGIHMVWESGLCTMYLVKGEHKSLVIDTGVGVERFCPFLKSLLPGPYEVVLTHGHVDHAGGLPQFERAALHPLDMALAASVSVSDRQDFIRRMTKAGAVSPEQVREDEVIPFDGSPALTPLWDGERIDLGDRQIEVLHTPGHTAGSVSLLDRERRVLFSGDTINRTVLMNMPGAPGEEDTEESRRPILREWYETTVGRFDALRPAFDIIAGGHGLCDTGHIASFTRGVGDYFAGRNPLTQKLVHMYNRPFIVCGELHVTPFPKNNGPF